MNVFLDESGDLGWSFASPYRNGGSSRFLTISALIVPQSINHLPKRIVRDVYSHGKHPLSRELKGKALSRKEKERFIQSVARLVACNPEIRIAAITVKKQNVWQHIRIDANKLYNYMVNLVILNHIKKYPSVSFIPDPRTIKVASGNSLVDYLQTKLWFEMNSATVIKQIPKESKRDLNLQFVDFISNIVWSRHEDSEHDAYNLLKPHISAKHLFF